MASSRKTCVSLPRTKTRGDLLPPPHRSGPALKSVFLYPEGSGLALRQKLAQHHDLDPSQFILGNGSNEIIELLGHVFLKPNDEVLVGKHAFVVYKLVALLMGAKAVEVEMPGLTHDLRAMREAVTDRTKLIFLPSPNNPTGTANSITEISTFVQALPEHRHFLPGRSLCRIPGRSLRSCSVYSRRAKSRGNADFLEDSRIGRFENRLWLWIA